MTARADTADTAPPFWDILLYNAETGGDYQNKYFTEAHFGPISGVWTADRQYGLTWSPGETKYFRLSERMPSATRVIFYMDYSRFDTWGYWSGDPYAHQTIDIASIVYYIGFNIWVKKSGEWIPVTEIWTKKGGVWQAVTDVSALKGGSWNPV